MANQILYGFHTIADAAARTVNDVTVPVVSDAIQQALTEHNRQIDALFGLFIERTTDFKTVFRTSTAGRLQPLEESGRARPIRVAGKYEVAFPLQKGGIAWGATREGKAKMTVQQVNDTLASMFIADNRWVRDHILAALFANVSWNYKDEVAGTLAIQGLANGDTVPYQIISGGDASATDNHYLAQAAGIADATDPFPVIYTELMEHPENGGGRVYAMFNSAHSTTVQGLAGFTKAGDPNIRLGANTDELIGDFGAPVPGKVLGYHDAGVWLIEWNGVPANYIIAGVTTAEKPIRMREHPEAELQGFKQVAERPDHPFWEAHYERIAGFGAWNRVGAVVYRVSNGTYAVPTNYTSPMP